MLRLKKHKIIIYWALVFLWMLLIFCLSAQEVSKSNKLSKTITKVIMERAEVIAPGFNFSIKKANHLLRKSAHFFIYLVLGALVMNVFKRSGMKTSKGIILSLAFCTLYALFDEFHQLFVPGRGAQVRDVFIDAIGAITGILGFLGISKL